MAEKNLSGKKVAILSEDGFEQSELLEPRQALQKAGADVRIVSPKPDRIRGWNKRDWGDPIDVDIPLEKANAEDFDALVLPGGVMNPDQLRLNPKAVEFVRAFFEQDKPVGAICHGPWMLAEAAVVEGRRLTSYASIKTDLINAGANWVDEEVVTDQGLVTSRHPGDIPAFNRKLIEEIAEGPHGSRREEARGRKPEARPPIQ
ncbi:MAG: type 1 glutamine amidotransferase [Bdellovibrionaceae bacterium]|nr:type 1 glutamine amidotransferase [Pseudobdellovibrionaceae bacterium]